MSNLWLNVRFGSAHLQWCYGDLFPCIGVNDWHRRDGPARNSPEWAWFEVLHISNPFA